MHFLTNLYDHASVQELGHQHAVQQYVQDACPLEGNRHWKPAAAAAVEPVHAALQHADLVQGPGHHQKGDGGGVRVVQGPVDALHCQGDGGQHRVDGFRGLDDTAIMDAQQPSPDLPGLGLVVKWMIQGVLYCLDMLNASDSPQTARNST